jgi:Protein of unknown function (DUF742)
MTFSAWEKPKREDGSGIRPFLHTPTPADPRTAPDPVREPDGPAPRPFVLTSGRVLGKDSDIGLETQVTARVDRYGRHRAPLDRLTPELQAIVALCAQPVSVAEISARLRLHLDVTRILVNDLRTAGYLDVHSYDSVNPNDPETILRVIRGLRALT